MVEIFFWGGGLPFGPLCTPPSPPQKGPLFALNSKLRYSISDLRGELYCLFDLVLLSPFFFSIKNLTQGYMNQGQGYQGYQGYQGQGAPQEKSFPLFLNLNAPKFGIMFFNSVPVTDEIFRPQEEQLVEKKWSKFFFGGGVSPLGPYAPPPPPLKKVPCLL